MLAGLPFSKGIFRQLIPISAVMIVLIITNAINVSLSDARTED